MFKVFEQFLILIIINKKSGYLFICLLILDQSDL